MLFTTTDHSALIVYSILYSMRIVLQIQPAFDRKLLLSTVTITKAALCNCTSPHQVQDLPNVIGNDPVGGAVVAVVSQNACLHFQRQDTGICPAVGNGGRWDGGPLLKDELGYVLEVGRGPVSDALDGPRGQRT